MRENHIATALGAVVAIFAILAFVWPGWAFGHPVWGPWGTTPPTGPVAGVATPAQPAAAAAPAVPSKPGGPSGQAGSSWTPAQKCAWLRQNFPQTTAGVQEFGARLAGVENARIRTHSYACDAATGVMDGFIVLGPNEGFQGEITITVPPGGAVDGYSPQCGAKYSSTPRVVAGGRPNPCDDTWRSTAGTVRGLSLTYWPWNDDAPPTGGAPPPAPGPQPTASAAVDCVQPSALASQKGWRDTDWADRKYGGRRVELTQPGELPLGWEGVSSGRKITENQPDRGMVQGFWTIYPPFACREQLGYQK